MNGTETEAQHASPKVGTPVADHDPNEEPMVKPFICSFFKRARTTTARNFNDRDSVNGCNGVGAGSPSRSSDNAAATQNHPLPPVSMEKPILLCPLTPSVKVPLQHSKRSGRVLNESETLQEKHAQEYRFIVPILAYAIECTIVEHEIIRQKAGLPAYASHSSSPLSSPTPKRRPSDSPDNDDRAAAFATEDSRSRVGSTDSASGAGDRNTAVVYKALQRTINAFSTREVPAISVHDYLKRIVKYTYVSPCVLVCCCLYLDRLIAMYPSFLLHPNNIFKFLITSTRVCSKIMDTRTLNNRDFSVVGGVTNEDINALEFMFVQLLQNRLYISHHTFDMYCDPLRRQAAHMDTEEEWEGATLAMVLPVNGNRPAGGPHHPSRPFFARSNACGSVMPRSRRSSIMSQNEYSLSMASQSGVSPLRSASRPAFPPSASVGQSISVEAETLTSARRYPINSGCPNNYHNSSSTSRSPVLPQVHLPATTNGAASAVPAMRNASPTTTLRNSGNFEDTGSSGGLAQSANGVFMNQIQQQMALDPLGDNEDVRARSIPVSIPRVFSSVDAARTTRTLASTIGGVGLSASVIATTHCSSPNGLVASTNASMTKSRNLDDVTVGTEATVAFGNAIVGERTPPRRIFVSSACSDGVALPPVPQSGRRCRSGSIAGNAGVAIPNAPPPPEFRQR